MAPQRNLVPLLAATAAATCVAYYLYQKSNSAESNSKPPPAKGINAEPPASKVDSKPASGTATRMNNDPSIDSPQKLNPATPTPERVYRAVVVSEKTNDNSTSSPTDVKVDISKEAEEIVKVKEGAPRASPESLRPTAVDQKAAEATLPTESPTDAEATRASPETLVEIPALTPESSKEKRKAQEQSPPQSEKTEPEPSKAVGDPETSHPTPTGTPPPVQTGENNEPLPNPETTISETTSTPDQSAATATAAEAKPEAVENEQPTIETSPEITNNNNTSQSELLSPAASIPPELPTPKAEDINPEETDLWDYLQNEIQKATKCAGCGKEQGEVKFKPCAKCRSAMYCGRNCQKKHWKSHKKVCCK